MLAHSSHQTLRGDRQDFLWAASSLAGVVWHIHASDFRMSEVPLSLVRDVEQLDAQKARRLRDVFENAEKDISSMQIFGDGSGQFLGPIAPIRNTVDSRHPKRKAGPIVEPLRQGVLTNSFGFRNPHSTAMCLDNWVQCCETRSPLASGCNGGGFFWVALLRLIMVMTSLKDPRLFLRGSLLPVYIILLYLAPSSSLPFIDVPPTKQPLNLTRIIKPPSRIRFPPTIAKLSLPIRISHLE